MNPGYKKPEGRVGTAALGAVLTTVDLAVSAFLWWLVAALMPEAAAWGAGAALTMASLALVAWPRPGRVRRLLYLWCAPVDFLRGLAVGWRRWLSGFPLLELVWRARFWVGIAALVQNWQEGTPLLGMIPAGIVAVSYLWPWLRRVHARRIQAAGPPRLRRVRNHVATKTNQTYAGKAEPQLKGAL